jgi:hypothetical protein
MAKKLAAVNQLRPKIVSQNLVNLEEMARRISKNTTYNPPKVSSILQLFVTDCIAALQTGETVKIDGLVMSRPT